MMRALLTQHSDIVDGNIKMILGLVWSLISHYQLQIPPHALDSTGKDKLTAKSALLSWVRGVIGEDIAPFVKDFTRSFQDGTVFSAMVNALHPNDLPPGMLYVLLLHKITVLLAIKVHQELLCVRSCKVRLMLPSST
jgi:hypothetical protein